MYGVRAAVHESEGGPQEVRQERWSPHQGRAVLRSADVARLESPQEVQHCPRRHQARQHPGKEPVIRIRYFFPAKIRIR